MAELGSVSVHLALSLRFKLQTALLVWDAWVSATSVLATLHQAHTWLLALRSTERSAVTCPAALPAESGDPLQTLCQALLRQQSVPVGSLLVSQREACGHFTDMETQQGKLAHRDESASEKGK